MTDIERAVIFGRDAAAYDDARPGYPEEWASHVLGLVEPSIAVEIGAGTGKATVQLADGRREIRCLEPDLEMARVLLGKGLPGVSVEVVRFEDWAGSRPADLVYAAQSWHWVDASIGYVKALECLRPGGVLALLWNVPIDRYARFVDVYERFGPEVLAEQDQRVVDRDHAGWLDDLSSHGFSECQLVTVPWASSLTAAQFRRLCSTYSDHMLIPEPRRTALLDALESAVNASGGWFEIEYETRVFTGRK